MTNIKHIISRLIWSHSAVVVLIIWLMRDERAGKKVAQLTLNLYSAAESLVWARHSYWMNSDKKWSELEESVKYIQRNNALCLKIFLRRFIRISSLAPGALRSELPVNPLQPTCWEVLHTAAVCHTFLIGVCVSAESTVTGFECGPCNSYQVLLADGIAVL